ncbi:MAG: hypothetical protein Fur0021_40320 [Candidatus Promineifilaceae bacterium]
MSYNNGSGMVSGSRTRYLPFGSYRTAPTQTFTDRGYTSQKHNNDLGLIYYNARYYLPDLNRFLSARIRLCRMPLTQKAIIAIVTF